MKDKDRELREILEGHDIRVRNVEGWCGSELKKELEDKTISQIKALYKPLGKEELIKILRTEIKWSPYGKTNYTMVDSFIDAANAIINARGGR